MADWPNWHGRVAAVVGSGPSLRREDCDELHERGVPTIAVNGAYVMSPHAQILYAADCDFWHIYPPARRHNGILVVSDKYASELYGLRFIPTEKRDPPLILDGPMCLGGSSSGVRAYNLAIRLGASAVMLLGIDNTVKHGSHFHGEHPGIANPSPEVCAKWAAQWAAAGAQALVPTFNCSPASPFDAFPRSTIEWASQWTG